MRLIDADRLKEKVLKWLPSDPCGIDEKEHPIETDIVVSLMMEIEEAPTVNEWIPCSERLPEPDYVKKIIVTMKNRNKNFSTIANYKEVTIRGEKIRRWEWNDRVNFPWEVIAWMPLPEPYKAESEDKE